MAVEKTIKVALAGCGTVGSGVADIVVHRGDALARRTGLRFEITRALVSNLHRERTAPLPKEVYTDDPADLARTDADMLVEVMGGTDTARTVVVDALGRGQPVVTANKALLALHGAEVYAAARTNETCVAFEASCAGGLPIVGALLRGLQANQLDTILGIFNSTCNFILSAMLHDGMAYADAVAEAQRCGYAEADPTLDVSGGDTAHKLTVLASLAFGLNLDFSQVALSGIDTLRLDDLAIAREMGYACKLIGVGRRGEGDTVSLLARPMLVPHGHPLAALTGTDSGVWTRGDVVGETFYSGAGAGSLPTASAVVADMIEVAGGAAQATFNGLRVYNDLTPSPTYLPADEVREPYYVRFGFDPAHPAAADDVQKRLRAVSIPVARVHQSTGYQAVAALTEPVSGQRIRTGVRMAAGDLHLVDEPVCLPVLAE
jgi:homoserine dehydrogenase